MSKPPALGNRPLVVSIGTTEPLTAAGLQLDVFLADRLEIRPVTIVTGVSAQNGGDRFSMHAVDAATVAVQCESLDDLPIAAVRVGAIPSMAAIRVVAEWLRRRDVPMVLDPVYSTSAGHRLLDEAAFQALVSELLPLARCITPNLDEAAELSGYAISTLAEMDAATLAIAALGPKSVLIKGGHLSTAPVDVFWDGERVWHYESTRLPHGMRGTGCVLAIAMTAALAHGQSMRQAIRVSREIVRVLISSARLFGKHFVVA